MIGKINFLNLAAVSLLIFMSFVSSARASPASSSRQLNNEQLNNGQIRGFRYTDCLLQTCLIVQAPQAWISSTGGGFIAESIASEWAHVEIRKNRKSVISKAGYEAVLRPEIDLLSIESDSEVILIQLSTLNVQVVRK
jgi:hypothetical protein